MSETPNSQYISYHHNKVLLIFAVLCFAGASLILATTPPASGYEYSLYEIYPLTFWILLGILFFSPFAYLYITASGRFRISFQKKNAYGLLVLSLATLLLALYIPTAGGYVMYAGGDTHTHLGYVLDICNSGFIPQDHYPYSHVFVSIMSLITGIQCIPLTHHIIPLFSALFVITIFCLSRSIRCTLYQTVAITALAAIPIMGNFITVEPIMPSTIGWQMIPLFFYCLYNIGFSKHYLKSYLVLGLILCVVFWFVHPETVVFLSVIISSTIVLFMVTDTFFGQQRFKHYTPIIIILLVLVVGFIYQLSLTWMFHSQIEVYYNHFTGAVTPEYSPFNQLSSDATYLRKIIILMERYGQLVILSFLSVLFLLYRLLGQKSQAWNRKHLLISILFIVSVLHAAFFLALGTATGVHVFRQYKYIVLFSLFLLGFYVTDILLSQKKNFVKQILSIVFMISLILIIIFSVGNFYPCPEIGQVNYQVTHQDISGMQVFYENRESIYLISETLARQHQMRYNALLYGLSHASEMNSIRGINDDEIEPPSGFGYEGNETLGEQYTSETYFLKYPPTKPYARRFMDTEECFAYITPEDYERFDADSSVICIQDGGVLQVYLIDPHLLI
jgi:hypothetical protein